MLFFRSEDHVDRWCEAWSLSRGAVLSLPKAWQLARIWFRENRGNPAWRRFTVDEIEKIFADLELTDAFWGLR